MKKLITASFIVATIFASHAIAQEKSTKDVKKRTSAVTSDPISKIKKDKNHKIKLGKSVTTKKPKAVIESDMRMPEKGDQKSKQWRKDGLEKRKRTQKVESKKSVKAVPASDDRKFGEYVSWEKRAQKAKDKDWVRLNEIISNKVNLPKESKNIIAKKREEIKRDVKAKRITEKEYKQLYTELNYAEEDVEKIEVWVGGKR